MKINLISVNKTMPTTPTQSSFSQIVMTISIGILIGFGVYGGMHYESILSRIAKTQNQQLQEQKADYHSVALTASTEQNSEEVVVEDQLSAQE
jgi:menaquinone-dependent protoporphyrinogen IX oxidase